MTNFKDIRNKIIDVLENNADTIQVVHKSRQTEYDGFPAAIVQWAGNTPEWHSTERDRKTYIFDIYVYYPIEDTTNHDEVEDILVDVMDELDTLFTNRKILGSVVDFVEPIPVDPSYDPSGEQPYRVAQITLRCVKHVNLSVLENQGS